MSGPYHWKHDPSVSSTGWAAVNALGTAIRCRLTPRQLLLDPTVLFAGYKVPHPLVNDILIKIQTDDRSNPAEALKRACQLLIVQTLQIKQQFMEQAKNIEMGMGPEAGAGMAAGAGMGGYDPYSDGLARVDAPGAGQGDVYDF